MKQILFIFAMLFLVGCSSSQPPKAFGSIDTKEIRAIDSIEKYEKFQKDMRRCMAKHLSFKIKVDGKKRVFDILVHETLDGLSESNNIGIDVEWWLESFDYDKDRWDVKYRRQVEKYKKCVIKSIKRHAQKKVVFAKNPKNVDEVCQSATDERILRACKNARNK
jgi:vacuolar-type H+-ATPase subunit E/Vma4